MNLPAAFASLAQSMSAAFGAPFYAGVVISQADPVTDDGGSISTPGTPLERGCSVQIDVATEAMRRSDGYSDGDVRFIILAATLDGGLDTDASVEVAAGPFAGSWLVSSIERDPAGIGWVGKGRRA
jgi:hypothetical protein